MFLSVRFPKLLNRLILMSRVSKRVSDLVYARDNYRCVNCGATGGLSIQHRRNAQMGGSKTAHTPKNLIVCCLSYNTAMESDALVARVARFNGHKLKSFEQPEKVPVWYAMEDNWFLLDDDGNRALTTPNEEVFKDVPF